jgi:L-amino acid N-acyltransferase YncA
MLPHDWDALRAIYLEGIATGNSTFEQSAPDWQTWDQGHLPSCRLVARAANEIPGQILGWTALSPVSRRQVYAGVAEFSVYVAERARGRGIGAALLQALIEVSEQEGIWTLQSGIFPENTASLELCRRFGFRVVGTRERIGCMAERWRDVVLLERRSAIAGV